MSSGGSARVRIGLVGYGRGGRFFHAPLIEQASDCALAGVVTRSPQRRVVYTPGSALGGPQPTVAF